MLASRFDKVFGKEADFWGSDSDNPVEDWQYEVANGDTRLGYWDWVLAQRDSGTDEHE